MVWRIRLLTPGIVLFIGGIGLVVSDIRISSTTDGTV